MFDEKKKKKFLKATRRQIGDETGFDSFPSHNGAELFCRSALIVDRTTLSLSLSVLRAVKGLEGVEEDDRW